MKIVHTADWHLGHRLGPYDRGVEHDAFLAWLLDAVHSEGADALFVCGDVFDRGNPPAEALARYYGFLAALRARCPALEIVVIGGNHDLAPRLDAPTPILDALRVHVVGAVDDARSIVKLRGASGDVEAVACALPFVRPMDVAHDVALGVDHTSGVASTITRLLERADRARTPGQALFALAHCHLVGAAVSMDSERPLFSGALPASVFSPQVAYTALGHLHLAQDVGSARIRYSGSPIGLSMTERHYRHAVTIVEVEREHVSSITQREIPRTVQLLRAVEGSQPLDVVLDALAALKIDVLPEHLRPFLDVRIALAGPVPDVRAQVELALATTPVRLVRVHCDKPEGADVMQDAAGALVDIDPLSVFAHLHERATGVGVPDHLRAAFLELVDSARADGGSA